jgi:uncharacterized protein (UPF0371 family)
MGVNRAGFGVTNDAVVREAAKQEIIRRYFRYRCEYIMGLCDKDSEERMAMLLQEIGVQPEYRHVVLPARQAAREAEERGKGNEGIFCGAALELRDGRIISGKNSPLMHAASSVVLNAIKHLAGLPDRMHLLSPSTLDSIGRLKKDILTGRTVSLDLEETLITLSISATTNPAAEMAMEKLKELAQCDVHMTHIPTPGDEAGLRRLGVNLTSDPNFSSKNLFVA